MGLVGRSSEDRSGERSEVSYSASPYKAVLDGAGVKRR